MHKLHWKMFTRIVFPKLKSHWPDVNDTTRYYTISHKGLIPSSGGRLAAFGSGGRNEKLYLT